MTDQLALSLPAPPAREGEVLVPARMVNEWLYCPRLAFLEWVEGEWADSGDTAEGRRVHVRSDKASGRLPDAEDEGALAELGPVRALTVSSERLGLIAKIDLLTADDGRVTVVDVKKGKRPHTAHGAWLPERAQVAIQAMILEDQGYLVEGAALWFAGSRERVPVALDADLRAAALTAASELRLAVAAGRRPVPLEDSPKCVRCSLAGLCLPDETNYLKRATTPPRPLKPANDPALPLYIQVAGARVRKLGEVLVVETDDGKVETPIADISEVALFGPVGITTPTLHELFARGVPVAFFSTGGWLLGHTVGSGPANAAVRTEQYRASFDDRRALALARGLVAAKLRNQRTFLRRNARPGGDEAGRADALARMKRLAELAERAPDLPGLLGMEGEGAALYFRHFGSMLSAAHSFAWDKRARRPPPDPVNALLGLAYALLMRTWLACLVSVGFDPYRGFLHQLRHGRPSLALDCMEPYRPLVADSAVVGALNNGEVGEGDFITSGGGCTLKPAGRRALIAAYERRLAQETTHPVFGYRVTMRRLFEVQARLLARHLDGELASWPHYTPR
jgi:CRISPR-associated exonuclease Cas4/CRISPR-associated protein Cas1